MARLGLVGFGAFGRFAARHLQEHADIVACDRADHSAAARALGVEWGTAAEVASCPVVMLAIPVQSYPDALPALAQALAPGALVIDTASVKVEPLRLLAAALPAGVEVIGTHPMFGPQSGRHGIRGLKLVLCDGRTPRARWLRRFLSQRLGLEVLERSAEEHDREIAYIQGLTHLMAKALREIKLPDLELATTAYRHLLQIEENLREDSDALFLTIQRHNPYVREARRELRRRLDEIEEWIEGEG
ncbi:MAG TPA: prephenate dehydrogenase/arogenate dehydrogenase family protein [Thermoanaerobaculia bacterium]|nr:prephenate dehydrogenase/arogenate dehydrogenase family protein [Thermoanaerobaculia bacterium]